MSDKTEDIRAKLKELIKSNKNGIPSSKLMGELMAIKEELIEARKEGLSYNKLITFLREQGVGNGYSDYTIKEYIKKYFSVDNKKARKGK